MKSIDQFLDRMPTKTYNCFDFVKEIWLYLYGKDVTEIVKGLVGDFANRKLNIEDLRQIKKLKEPVSPCFVAMQRSKYTPHIGIYLDGRILHLKDTGVEFQPLIVAKSYFQIVSYYSI